MLTFKQFLIEGGKAMAEFNVVPVTKSALQLAVKSISEVIKIPNLEKNLVGSSALLYSDKIDREIGDIDIAILDSGMQDVIDAMKAVQLGKPRITAKYIYSYAIKAGEDPVQVDLIFCKSLDWASLIFKSFADSKFPSAVRNILLMSLVSLTLQHGKDLRILNADGEVIGRASRSLNLTHGAIRKFKSTKQKKDGSGRTKGMDDVSPDEIESLLAELGHGNVSFAKEEDPIDTGPELVKLVFGDDVSRELELDGCNAETLIAQIKKYRSDAADVFAEAEKRLDVQKVLTPETLDLFKQLTSK